MDKALTSRARIFLDQGDFVSADRALREALEINQTLYGPAHPNTLVRLQNVATVSMMQGAYARAETQRLAPMEYTGFLWAALFGWLFFAEKVPPATIGGALLIVAGCWIATRGKPPEPENAVA